MRRLILLLALLAGAGPAGAAPAVTGTVLSPDGAPLAGARVRLLPFLSVHETGRGMVAGLAGPAPAAVTSSDADGRFRLAPASPGPWRLAVTADGFVPMHYFPLVLTAPTELHRLVLSPDRGAEIRALDADGAPLAGAQVWAAASAGTEVRAFGGWRPDLRSGRTDDDGRVALARGETEHLDVGVVASPRRIASTLGVTGIVVRLPAATPARLEVVDRDGRGVAGVLARAPNLLVPLAISGADGRIDLPATGPDVVLSTADGWRHALPRPPAADAVVRVERGGPTAISGRILDASGRRPLPGAVVWSGPDPGIHAVTDAQGRYRLPVPPDPGFWLQAEAVGYVPQSLSIEVEHLASGRAPTVTLRPARALEARVEAPGGAPLGGVLVEAIAQRGGRPRGFFRPDPLDGRALSDARGRFRIDGLEGGLRYQLRLSRSGFVASVETFDGPSPGRRFVLTPARGAFGRVLDDRERPIAGAEVILRATGQRRPAPSPAPPADDAPKPPRFRGWSAADGRFEIAEIPAEEIQLTAYREGYAPLTVRGIRVPAESAAAAPRPVDLGTVILVPGLDLEGRVVDPQGEGVAEAAVHVLRGVDPARLGGLGAQRLAEQQPDAVSAADGRFRVGDLVAGELVHLFFHRAGYLSAWLEQVEVPTAEPLSLVLRPGSRVAGRVTDEDASPIEGVQLMIEQDLMPPVRRLVSSDVEGRFAFEDLRAGPASLSVFHAAYVGPDPFDLEVAAEGSKDLLLVLERGAVLAGEVKTASGEPIDRARVAAGNAGSFTDAEGVYRLEGVTPGAVTVEAYHPHYGLSSEETTIELGVNGLDLTFPDGHEVSGRVIDQQGRAITGATVKLTFDAGRGVRDYQDRSAADGGFRLRPVADGEYRLEAHRAGFASAAPVTVAVAGAQVTDLEVVLDGGIAVAGEVVGLEFEELARVRVWAERDGAARVPGHVDYQGGYEVVDLAPGGWLLRASLDQGRRQARARLDLAPDVTPIRQDLRFEPRSTLSGRVLLDGEPLPGTKVSLDGLDLAVSRLVVSDYRGAFRIEDLDPGSYRLGLANGPSRLVYNRDIEIDGDRDLMLDMRQARLSGRVLEAESGRGVDGALVVLRRQRGDGGVTNVLSAASGPEGGFDFLRVPEGYYQLQVHKDGYDAVARFLDVAAGDRLRDLELTVTATRGLDLEVSLASGEIPPAVTVLVVDPAGQALLTESRAADGAGRVRLPTVPAGSWQVVVSAPGTAASSVSAEVPGPPVSVRLRPAGSFDVRVPALATSDLTADIRLVGPDQRPLSTLEPARGLVDSWQLVAGRTRVGGVPPGLWQLRVTAADGQVWSDTAVAEPGQQVDVELR